jgi:hypothetical protein
MTSPTLSSLIDSLQTNWERDTLNTLLSELSRAQVGIVAINVPKEFEGKTVETRTAGAQGIGLGNTVHGDGKTRVVAFAEPQEFIARFGRQFNGEISGKQLFRAVLHNPACHGILLNSATAPVSLPIERAAILEFVQADSPSR